MLQKQDYNIYIYTNHSCVSTFCYFLFFRIYKYQPSHHTIHPIYGSPSLDRPCHKTPQQLCDDRRLFLQGSPLPQWCETHEGSLWIWSWDLNVKNHSSPCHIQPWEIMANWDITFKSWDLTWFDLTKYDVQWIGFKENLQKTRVRNKVSSRFSVTPTHRRKPHLLDHMVVMPTNSTTRLKLSWKLW